MDRHTIKWMMIILISFFLLACGAEKQTEIYVEVSAALDGKPVSQAKVLIDGIELGTTDGNGYFSKRIKKQPGAEVEVAVSKEIAGYRIEPWKDTFVVKLPKQGAVDTYPFRVDLNGTKYFTVYVTHGDAPLSGADIGINGQTVAKTDENGEYVHTYTQVSKRGMKLSVRKKGYEPYQKTVRVDPGELLEVAIAKQKVQVVQPKPAPVPAKKVEVVKKAAPAATVAAVKKKPRPKTQKAALLVVTNFDAYGLTKPISGISVRINDKQVGKTNAKGSFTYTHRGAPTKVKLTLTAPGYIPETWETTTTLSGRQRIQRYFYPAAPKPIKMGVYGYVNNSPETDLSLMIEQIEDEVANNFKRFASFRTVAKKRLRDSMLATGLDMETAATKGWQNTPLIRLVDMVILGSVSKGDSGFTIETSVLTSDGNMMLSQISRARSAKEIKKTANVIVNNIMAQFPFEGTIASVDDDGYRINLGQYDYKIRRGSEFRYMAANLDPTGRVKGFREAGTLRVIKTDEASSWAEVANISEGEEIKIGDKVVRLAYLEEEREATKDSFILSAQGGFPPEQKPLWGVNVYLDNTWVGTTGSNGKVEVPVRLYEEYNLLLTRHGYQQVRDTLSVDASKQVKGYFFEVANAAFNVESEPTGGDVYVDGVKIGQTPMLDGKLVNFGFRKVRLAIGGEYRDWEKVIEFNNSEVNLTGSNKVVFLKDWMKIGRNAEASGNYDAAIQAYVSTERENPDYSAARNRLAQLYMDEKNDYDAAIREFENVLSLPENRQVIYKQYAVTYTNLGHAYYEKGNEQVLKDKRAAAGNFAKAVQKLKIAKQNTRFFPNSQFDEAVHDTYYYLAISYHKLYLITKKSSILYNAKLAWREYFDFFPKNLESNSGFVKMRNSARKYYSQIKDLS